MRQGPFELLILRSDGTTIAEHELDGKHYIAAEPNTEYRVKVVVHPDELGNLPFSIQKARIYVDGRAVNYYSVLSNSRKAAIYIGFRQEMDVYQTFMFAEPSDGGTHHNTVRAESVGSIKMTIHETIQSTKQFKPNFKQPPVDYVSASEGKKFWQQPSLQTVGGRIIKTTLVSKPVVQYYYNDVRTAPDATLEIFYHTTDMLDFLKTFHGTKKEPKAVAPPLHVDLSTQEVASPVRAPAETVDLTQPAGRAKVKRENKGGTRARAAKKPRTAKGGGGASDVVDLM